MSTYTHHTHNPPHPPEVRERIPGKVGCNGEDSTTNRINDPSPASAVIPAPSDRAAGSYKHRRHARPCSLALQLSEADVHHAPRPGPGGKPDRFIVTLEAEPAATPAAIRLRQLLKLALRAFAMRCVDVRQADAGGCDHERGVKQGKATGDGEYKDA